MADQSTCRSCGAKIRWAKTKNCRSMPLDAEPVFGGNVEIGEDGLARVVKGEGPKPRYKSHFVTCPNSNQHRKPK